MYRKYHAGFRGLVITPRPVKKKSFSFCFLLATSVSQSLEQKFTLHKAPIFFYFKLKIVRPDPSKNSKSRWLIQMILHDGSRGYPGTRDQSYSVTQSYANSFCGDVSLGHLYNVSRDEGNILDKIYKKQICPDFY